MFDMFLTSHFASMRRGKLLPTIVRSANAPGTGCPAWAVAAARIDSKQAGAIAPLERSAKLRQMAKCEGGGDKNRAEGAPRGAFDRHPAPKPAPNRSEYA